MTPRQDPYRVLGLVPGATAGEIRSAYRRLAKLNHPDTAGERALPRFLAIKAAYEELVDGDGRLRSGNWPGRGGAAGAGRRSGSAPNGASREAWRARRAADSADGGSASGGPETRRPGSAGSNGRTSGSGPAPGSKAGGSSGAGTGPAPGKAGKAGPNPRAGGRPKSADRRTARPGSTTYDEAAQPLDPSWEGGSWYGASSGSYWTLNPREYADPRKHGPEYQERARRAAQLEAARRRGATLSPDEASYEPTAPPWAPPSAPSPTPSPDPLPHARRATRRSTAPDGP